MRNVQLEVERLPLLAGLSPLDQYLVLWNLFGVRSHGLDAGGPAQRLRRRLDGLDAFIETVYLAYGELIAPFDLTADHFAVVIKAWYASGITDEFAERAKVAAWLFDLVIGEYDCPYPKGLM